MWNETLTLLMVAVSPEQQLVGKKFAFMDFKVCYKTSYFILIVAARVS